MLPQLINQRFGALVVVNEGPARPRGGRLCLVLCNCGAIGAARPEELRSGRAKSCGCGVHKRADCGGLAPWEARACTPEYRAWRDMKGRCHTSTHRDFRLYGARGIRVCDEWRRSYEAFLAHIGPRTSSSHSPDRIHNSRGHEPGNVRWATQTTQQRNKRNNRIVTVGGESAPLVVWCERTGITVDRAYARIRKGWSAERAVSTPVIGRIAA